MSSLSALGARANLGTTATYGLARPQGASVGVTTTPSSDRKDGLTPASIGVMIGGAVGLVGGIALTFTGHRKLGLGIAGLGAAALGATLLSGCGGPKGPAVPGDEGPPGDSVSTFPGTLKEFGRDIDTTNPAPAGYDPKSGSRDAREGVVQLSHSGGTGSGWVVEPGTVITNYHVAQGHRELDVYDHTGKSHDGIVRTLDRDHDLAIVDVPTLTDTPFKLDDTVEFAEAGETTGYPGGEFSNDRAVAVGSIEVDDDGQRRRAIFFGGTSDAGVSGGAVINGAGEVMGTAFAVGDLGDSGDPDPFVLAIPNDQVKSFLDASPKPVAAR